MLDNKDKNVVLSSSLSNSKSNTASWVYFFSTISLNGLKLRAVSVIPDIFFIIISIALLCKLKCSVVDRSLLLMLNPVKLLDLPLLPKTMYLNTVSRHSFFLRGRPLMVSLCLSLKMIR